MSLIPQLLAISELNGMGAGIVPDLKTMTALGTHGSAIELVGKNQMTVATEMDELLVTHKFSAVKLGLMPQADMIETIARKLKQYQVDRIVVDPVIVTRDGDRLLDMDALNVLKRDIIVVSTIITPNLQEASILLGRSITRQDQMEKAAEDLLTLGSQAVLLKGDYESTDRADDYLVTALGQGEWLRAARMDSNNTVGAGCILASAIAAYLAQGHVLFDAARLAKEFLTETIARSMQGNDYLHKWIA